MAGCTCPGFGRGRDFSTISASCPVVRIGAVWRARTMLRAMRREARSSPNWNSRSARSASSAWLTISAADVRTRWLDVSLFTGHPLGERLTGLKLEYRLIAKSGKPVWVRDEAILVTDDEGKPAFWQGFLLDVSDRKALEERFGVPIPEGEEAKQIFASVEAIAEYIARAQAA